MKELYWIGVLGTIGTLAWVIFGLSIFVFIVLSYIYFDENYNAKFKSQLKKTAIVIISSCIVGIFVPSKCELYTIYGVGSVIDYIQQSPDAQELPDNTIKMLNELAKRYADNNKKETNEK